MFHKYMKKQNERRPTQKQRINSVNAINIFRFHKAF